MDNILDVRRYHILRSVFLNANEDLKNSVKMITIFGNRGEEMIYITNDDNVYVFGRNHSGCLGIGSDKPVTAPKQNLVLSGKKLVNIFTGLDHCIGLTAEGKCWSWGFNDFGRLGIGHNSDAHTPKLIQEIAHKVVVQVSCGSAHTLALTSDRKVFSWGRNHFGQLGLSHFKNRHLPNLVSIRTSVVSISAGLSHSVALTQSGKVFVWGLNDCGQLGMCSESVQTNSKKTSCLNVPVVLKSIAEHVLFKSIVCGKSHTILLSTEGVIYLFGSNRYGQIGNGKTCSAVFYPFQIPFSVKYKEIIADRENNISMAISEDDTIYVWGNINGHKCEIPRKMRKDFRPSIYDSYMFVAEQKITFKTVLIGEEANKMYEQLKDGKVSSGNNGHNNTSLRNDNPREGRRRYGRNRDNHDNKHQILSQDIRCKRSVDEPKMNSGNSIVDTKNENFAEDNDQTYESPEKSINECVCGQKRILRANLNLVIDMGSMTNDDQESNQNNGWTSLIASTFSSISFDFSLYIICLIYVSLVHNFLI